MYNYSTDSNTKSSNKINVVKLGFNPNYHFYNNVLVILFSNTAASSFDFYPIYKTL